MEGGGSGTVIGIIIAIIVVVGIVGGLIFYFRSQTPVCPTNAFLDITTNQCYKCPDKYTRTLSSIDAPDACKLLQTCEDAFPGSKLDVGTSKCWQCPPNYDRTVFPIDDDKSCQSNCIKLYGEGSFEDGLTGNCYKCPSGYNIVVLEPVTSSKKCQVSDCKTAFLPVGGELVFGDPNGNCYSCPSGYSRTWDPVTSDTSCQIGLTGQFS